MRKHHHVIRLQEWQLRWYGQMYLLPIGLGIELNLGLRKVHVWVVGIGRKARIIERCVDQQAELVTPTYAGCFDCSLSCALIFIDFHLCGPTMDSIQHHQQHQQNQTLCQCMTCEMPA